MIENNKYNELEFAEYLFNNGLDGYENMHNKLRLVAIYMRRIKEYKPKVLKEELYKYAEKYIRDYKKEKYYIFINKAINQAVKKGSCLLNIESIDVYKEEFDFINNFKIESKNEHNCKKLMFTILCKMKINREIFNTKNIGNKKEYNGIFFQGGQRKYNELKKISKLPNNIRINEDIIHDLYKNNLVTPMYNGMVRFDFMNKINELESKELFIKVKQFEDIGWYYDYYTNTKTIKICNSCSKLIRINSKHDGSTKYCDKCAYEIKLEQVRECKHRKREELE